VAGRAERQLALHHVALGAADVERVAEFYRQVFGLPEVTRHHDDAGALRSVWLDLGSSATLMIERTQARRSAVIEIGHGAFLLAFRVPPEQRAELEDRLERAGASIEARTPFSSYARDPEGNRIACSHYPIPVL
jgi:hypothetical protein